MGTVRFDGNGPRHRGPMELRAVAAVQREWAGRRSGAHAAALLGELCGREPSLAAVGAGSLAELVAAVRPPAEAGPAVGGPDRSRPVEGWEVASALVRQVRVDELVGLGLLDALVPGLVALGGKLDWGRGGPWDDVDGFGADLVTTTWLILDGAAGTTLCFPFRTILDRARKHLAAQREAARRRAGREQWHPLIEGESAAVGRHAALIIDRRPVSLLETLATALAGPGASLLAREDVRLLFRNRVLGYSLAELAADSGQSVAALRGRRHRAEAALCTR